MPRFPWRPCTPLSPFLPLRSAGSRRVLGDQCVQVYREDLVGLEVLQNVIKINE